MRCLVRLVSDEHPESPLLLRVLGSWAERLRGLIGTGPDAEGVLLVRCASIHTFGMRYPIDVAFVGERGEVLRVCRSLGPRGGASCHGARCVIERPACEGAWVEEGEHLWVASVTAEALGT
nr:DUF192 domain-containing protein [Olsenella profusa]